MSDEQGNRFPGDFGVVGSEAASIAERVRDAGGRASVIAPDETETVDVVIVSGEAAMLELVRKDLDAPVLAVDVGSGVEDVAGSDFESALETLEAGKEERVPRPLLDVDVGEDNYAALMDVMLVTTEPAKISEFAVENRIRESAPVDQVRADGVVVATSAGTPGYATAAGGPVLGPKTSGVSVVPVGPFRVERTHWVLEPPMAITVARDDAAVSLLVDDEQIGRVTAHEPVGLSWGKPLTLLRTPVSRTAFDREY